MIPVFHHRFPLVLFFTLVFLLSRFVGSKDGVEVSLPTIPVPLRTQPCSEPSLSWAGHGSTFHQRGSAQRAVPAACRAGSAPCQQRSKQEWSWREQAIPGQPVEGCCVPASFREAGRCGSGWEKGSECMFFLWFLKNPQGPRGVVVPTAAVEAMDGGFVTQTKRSLTTGREFAFG